MCWKGLGEAEEQAEEGEEASREDIALIYHTSDIILEVENRTKRVIA